jgi:hypothetical protein
MKPLAVILLVLGFPLCAFIIYGAVSGGLGDVPFWSLPFLLLINALLACFPQLILGLFYLVRVISKSTFLGGLLAGHILLGSFFAWLILRTPADAPEDDAFFLYFPICFVVVPLGTVIGYLLNRFRFSKEVSASPGESL